MNVSFLRLLALFALLMIWTTACSPEGVAPVGDDGEETPVTSTAIAATATFTPSPTPLPSDTAEPTHTTTSTHTPTPAPTSTPSATPTPFLNGVVAYEVLTVYSGPGDFYEPFAALAKGVPVILIAVDPDLRWGMIDMGFGQTGWVELEGVELTGPITELPTALPPPTPTGT